MSYTPPKIQANEINIHPSVEIGDNVEIICDKIKIGNFLKNVIRLSTIVVGDNTL